MLKTEITFERVLGTFAPGALFMFGGWYLHRPFFLKYFPNLVGGLVEKSVDGVQQIEPTGGVSLGAKLVLFAVISFCVGMLLNQMADVTIAFLFVDEPKTDTRADKAKRFVKKIIRLATLTYTVQDPRVKALSAYLNSAWKKQFQRMLRDWTRAEKKMFEKFEPERAEWSAGTKNEAILVHQNILTRLEVTSGVSRKAFDEDYFSLNFVASLMMTFVLLLPVGISAFYTAGLAEGTIKVHYGATLVTLLLIIYGGVMFCGLLLKRQFKKLCWHLLAVSFHTYLLEDDVLKNERKQNAVDKVTIDLE